ncbi:hypothetical protein [Nonomuraea gerenzanensis]|uniref:Uncharacterized protein n=1 Tax=Nonomuraea gerenzanensis TaxID=93944 RepID=A0A1M4ED45_9ACTN|nr:hypothetical protein [Nonomuraea gerenzanensis]UBU18727.1 hypothetical protein LCN96_28030 [Nonomuraea gerenzanensis]SBO96588.1 hypothetical protein BN4615_P6104 [Nonomuraea gerenzanensis]
MAASLLASAGTSLSITASLAVASVVSLVAALMIPRDDAERLGDRPAAIAK